MEKERFEYMLSQRNLENSSEINIEIDDEHYEFLKEMSKQYNMSIENIAYCFLLEMMMKEKKSKIKVEDEDEEVIDIFDFYKLEELLNTQKTYIVATYDSPVVIVPIDKFNSIMDEK